MSKTIYMQQLGRGTRRCPGKDDLLVIDFVDNANMFNMPYSLHRVLDISKYQPMAYVLAPENKRKLDQDMLFKGEKPERFLYLILRDQALIALNKRCMEHRLLWTI